MVDQPIPQAPEQAPVPVAIPVTLPAPVPPQGLGEGVAPPEDPATATQVAAAPAQPDQPAPGIGEQALDATNAFTGTAKDMGRGLVNGIAKGVNATAHSIDEVGAVVSKAIKGIGIPDVIISRDHDGVHAHIDRDPTYDPSEGQFGGTGAVSLPEPFRPTTVMGHATENAAQFLTGMAAFGSVGKAFQLAGAAAGVTGVAGKLATLSAGEVAKSGLSNAFAFDSRDGMLGDMLKQYPALADHVSPFLASDPTDTVAEARFKRGIEGTMMGAFGETVLSGVRVFKYLKAGNVEAATQAAEETQIALAKSHTPSVDPQAAPLSEGQIAGDVPLPGEEGTGLGASSMVSPRDANGNLKVGRVPDLLQTEPVHTPFDEGQLADFRGALQRNEDWLADGGVLPESVMMNPNRFDRTGNAALGITTLEDQIKAVKGPMDGPQSWDGVKKVANIIGITASDLVSSMRQDAADLSTLGPRVVAYGNYVVGQSTYVQKLANLLNTNMPGKFGTMDMLEEEFKSTFSSFHEAVSMTKQISTSIARGLNAHKIGLDGEGWAGMSPNTASQIKQLDLSPEGLRAAAEAIGMARNPAEIVAALNAPESLGTKAINGLNSYLMTSLLSMGTVVRKGGSDLFMATMTPLERILSGSYQTIGGAGYGAYAGAKMVATGQGGNILSSVADGAGPGITRVKEGFGYYSSFIRYVTDSATAAAKAFRLGQQITDITQAHPTTAPMGNGEVFSNLLEGNQGAVVVNAAANFVNFPKRIIGTIEEFTKNLSYRAEVARKSWQQVALDDTIGNKQQAVNDMVNKSFTPEGGATDLDALDFAQRQTFSNQPVRDPEKLGFGANKSATAVAMDVANSIPILRSVAPFIKVPGNISRYQWTRTPGINLLQKEFRDDLLAGGERTANAMAKMTTGGAIAAYGAHLANSGFITGTLSDNPAIQKQMEQLNGVKHSSYVFRNADGSNPVFVPLASFADPLGPMLTATADYTHILQHCSVQEGTQCGTALATIFGKGLEDKQYFKSLANLHDALSQTMDPELTGQQKSEKFFAQMASQYVPSMLSNHGDGDDLYHREIRGYLDGALRKGPGSIGLDPSRNVLGEPVQNQGAFGPADLSPFQQSHADTSIVSNELARQLSMGSKPLPKLPYKVGFDGLPSEVDLTKIPGNHGFTAYDRLQELMGSPGHGALPMRQQFEKMMEPGGKYWTQLTDSNGQLEGSRANAINAVYGEYQAGAIKALKAENPTIQGMIKAEADNQVAQRRGMPLPHPELVKQNLLRNALTQ
jgi:hypothetical protein